MKGLDRFLNLRGCSLGAGALILRAAWACLRSALVAMLVALEPLVRFALTSLALLLVLMALFLEAVSSRSVPLFGMIAAGLGCVAILAVYQGIIRVLS